MRQMLFRLLALILFAFAALPAKAADMLALAGWPDAVDPAVLDSFTRETGTVVSFDAVVDADAFDRKLTTGKSDYDLVFLNSASLDQLGKAGALKPLDAAKLPNAAGVVPLLRQGAAQFDPGNRFAVPYMWGGVAFGVDEAKVRDRLGVNAPRSWDLLLKPELSSKLRDCGISVVDVPDAVLPGVMRALGSLPASQQPADLIRAADALLRVRGNIRRFHAPAEVNSLAGGEVCLMVGRSRDLAIALQRARAAGSAAALAIWAPREGAPIWFDSLAIPKDAPNAEKALALMNFLLHPEIAARNAAYLRQSNSATAYPDQATSGAMFVVPVRNVQQQVAIDRVWARVKASR